MAATLELAGVEKAFGATRVLHGIDLRVEEGEMIVVVGASGCGKSTLLRIVAGLEEPTAGRVRIGGRGGRTVGHGGAARPEAAPAFGGAAAAGGDGPRHRGGAGAVPVRRAAVQP